ncbi:uncharacterized protein LOC109714077 [Ananas comosus]|uniref:Uncharacterized protein LOC109714077 n=1 Tax=Ananas comosus TaxID=4615 RepID=A0A6P5FLQ3_ANACO|nr:uncharacterized protein LOC109714077 [Ananas comosus]
METLDQPLPIPNFALADTSAHLPNPCAHPGRRQECSHPRAPSPGHARPPATAGVPSSLAPRAAAAALAACSLAGRARAGTELLLACAPPPPGDGRAASLRPPAGTSATGQSGRRRRSCGLRPAERDLAVGGQISLPRIAAVQARPGRLPPASDNRSPSPGAPPAVLVAAGRRSLSLRPRKVCGPSRTPPPARLPTTSDRRRRPLGGHRRRPEPFRGRRRRRSRTQAPLSPRGLGLVQHRRSRLPPSNDVSTGPSWSAALVRRRRPRRRSSSSAGASRVLFGFGCLGHHWPSPPPLPAANRVTCCAPDREHGLRYVETYQYVSQQNLEVLGLRVRAMLSPNLHEILGFYVNSGAFVQLCTLGLLWTVCVSVFDLWTDCPCSVSFCRNRRVDFDAFFGKIRRKNAVSVRISFDVVWLFCGWSLSLVGWSPSSLCGFGDDG